MSSDSWSPNNPCSPATKWGLSMVSGSQLQVAKLAQKVSRVCPRSPLGLPWVCPGSASGLPKVYPGSAPGLPWVCPGSAPGLPQVFPWSPPGSPPGLAQVKAPVKAPLKLLPFRKRRKRLCSKSTTISPWGPQGGPQRCLGGLILLLGQ